MVDYVTYWGWGRATLSGGARDGGVAKRKTANRFLPPTPSLGTLIVWLRPSKAIIMSADLSPG